MKFELLLSSLLFLLFTSHLSAQYEYNFEASVEYPFGRLNPKANKHVGDYEELIGLSHCKSVARIDQNTWADTVNMNWTFKYIMNGMAVLDETLKADDIHSGSIRQYSADSAKWYVHYYSVNSFTNALQSWEGNRKENKIILYRDSPAPNGTPGDYRLTFTIHSKDKFDWAGEWVNKTETFVYPTWRIQCEKKIQ